MIADQVSVDLPTIPVIPVIPAEFCTSRREERVPPAKVIAGADFRSNTDCYTTRIANSTRKQKLLSTSLPLLAPCCRRSSAVATRS